MEGFDRIQETLFQVRNKLLNNHNIRKILVYDTSSALESGSVPTFEAAKEYIFVSPVFKTNVEPYNKATFITITMTKTLYDDEENFHNVAIKINCMSRTELWEMDNNKIRVIQLMTEILSEVNGIKFDSSHKFEYDSSDLIVLDEDIQGYTMIFGLIDGGGELGENF